MISLVLVNVNLIGSSKFTWETCANCAEISLNYDSRDNSAGIKCINIEMRIMYQQEGIPAFFVRSSLTQLLKHLMGSFWATEMWEHSFSSQDKRCMKTMVEHLDFQKA